MVLSQMLMKNTALRHLHCDMNRIYLQGFSAIVNAMEYNTTLLYIPSMHWDRLEQIKVFKEQFKGANASTENLAPPPQPLFKSSFLSRKSSAEKKAEKKVVIKEPPTMKVVKPSMNRQLSTVGEESGVMHIGAPISKELNPDDLVKILDEKWEVETERLTEFLERNGNLYDGREYPSVEWFNTSSFNNDAYTAHGNYELMVAA